MFFPNSFVKKIWDIWIIILVLYNVFFIPLDISLEASSKLPSYFYFVDYLVDAMFFIDIILTFRTVLVKEHGYFSVIRVKQTYIIKDKGEIAKRYLKSTFFVDLIASLPLEFLSIFCKFIICPIFEF